MLHRDVAALVGRAGGQRCWAAYSPITDSARWAAGRLGALQRTLFFVTDLCSEKGAATTVRSKPPVPFAECVLKRRPPPHSCSPSTKNWIF